MGRRSRAHLFTSTSGRENQQKSAESRRRNKELAELQKLPTPPPSAVNIVDDDTFDPSTIQIQQQIDIDTPDDNGYETIMGTIVTQDTSEEVVSDVTVEIAVPQVSTITNCAPTCLNESYLYNNTNPQTSGTTIVSNTGQLIPPQITISPSEMANNVQINSQSALTSIACMPQYTQQYEVQNTTLPTSTKLELPSSSTISNLHKTADTIKKIKMIHSHRAICNNNRYNANKGSSTLTTSTEHSQLQTYSDEVQQVSQNVGSMNDFTYTNNNNNGNQQSLLLSPQWYNNQQSYVPPLPHDSFPQNIGSSCSSSAYVPQPTLLQPQQAAATTTVATTTVFYSDQFSSSYLINNNDNFYYPSSSDQQPPPPPPQQQSYDAVGHVNTQPWSSSNLSMSNNHTFDFVQNQQQKQNFAAPPPSVQTVTTPLSYNNLSEVKTPLLNPNDNVESDDCGNLYIGHTTGTTHYNHLSTLNLLFLSPQNNNSNATPTLFRTMSYDAKDPYCLTQPKQQVNRFTPVQNEDHYVVPLQIPTFIHSYDDDDDDNNNNDNDDNNNTNISSSCSSGMLDPSANPTSLTSTSLKHNPLRLRQHLEKQFEEQRLETGMPHFGQPYQPQQQYQQESHIQRILQHLSPMTGINPMQRYAERERLQSIEDQNLIIRQQQDIQAKQDRNRVYIHTLHPNF